MLCCFFFGMEMTAWKDFFSLAVLRGLIHDLFIAVSLMRVECITHRRYWQLEGFGEQVSFDWEITWPCQRRRTPTVCSWESQMGKEYYVWYSSFSLFKQKATKINPIFSTKKLKLRLICCIKYYTWITGMNNFWLRHWNKHPALKWASACPATVSHHLSCVTCPCFLCPPGELLLCCSASACFQHSPSLRNGRSRKFFIFSLFINLTCEGFKLSILPSGRWRDTRGKYSVGLKS